VPIVSQIGAVQLARAVTTHKCLARTRRLIDQERRVRPPPPGFHPPAAREEQQHVLGTSSAIRPDLAESGRCYAAGPRENRSTEFPGATPLPVGARLCGIATRACANARKRNACGRRMTLRRAVRDVCPRVRMSCPNLQRQTTEKRDVCSTALASSERSAAAPRTTVVRRDRTIMTAGGFPRFVHSAVWAPDNDRRCRVCRGP
jgi:hypothetical protein